MDRRTFFKTIVASAGMLAITPMFAGQSETKKIDSAEEVIELTNNMVWTTWQGRLITGEGQTVTIHPKGILVRI